MIDAFEQPPKLHLGLLYKGAEFFKEKIKSVAVKSCMAGNKLTGVLDSAITVRVDVLEHIREQMVCVLQSCCDS